MTIHSAIKSFLDLNLDSVTVSVLSCVSSCLRESAVAQDLVEQHHSVCRETLDKLVSVSNDSSKNPNARILALECLYEFSHVRNETFCRGDLFDAVQKLNESFEQFLGCESAEAWEQQHKILTVLLFRCSGYTRLKAGDLLQQLFNGDDTCFIAVLQKIMEDQSLEWDIIHACMRCMFELTTPISYFSPPEEDAPISTTAITAFQGKITALLIHLSQCGAVHALFSELSSRWSMAKRDAQFGAVLEGEIPVSNALRSGTALDFVAVFRYLMVMLLNVADFCERMELVRGYQQSFLAQHQHFLGGTLIPFVHLALRCWESMRDAACDSSANPFMAVSIAALRFLRFAFYRGGQELQETLASSLAALVRRIEVLEPQLCTEYSGMLVLVLTVETLCNINAVQIPSIAPHFTSLIDTVSLDKTPLRTGAQFTAAQAFAYCMAHETSTYSVSDNASFELVRQKIREGDPESTSEAVMAMQLLEEQLGLLQSLMMELTVGQLLGDLCLLIPLTTATTGTDDGNRNTTVTTDASISGVGVTNKVANTTTDLFKSKDTAAKTSTMRKKKRHPLKYLCMLTKKLMREPVVLRNGHHFELDALQEVVDRVGHVDPLTGEAFSEELLVDMGLQQEIARYRVEMAARREPVA